MVSLQPQTRAPALLRPGFGLPGLSSAFSTGCETVTLPGAPKLAQLIPAQGNTPEPGPRFSHSQLPQS